MNGSNPYNSKINSTFMNRCYQRQRRCRLVGGPTVRNVATLLLLAVACLTRIQAFGILSTSVPPNHYILAKDKNRKSLSPLFLSSGSWNNNKRTFRRNNDFTSRSLPIFTTLDPSTISTTESELVSVQRSYETFRWKYRTGFETKEELISSNDDNEEDGASGYYYNINYRVEGPVDGTPILLVHGFGANVNHFRHQFPALTEAGYRVYAVDLIGFGASDKPISKPGSKRSDEPFGYSIELFVALLEDFINYADSNKVWHIAGNSIGGLCSLKIAADYPSRVKSVTLFNCAGGMTVFRYEELPLWLRPILYFFQKIVLGPYFGPRFFTNFKSRDNVEQILKSQGVYCNTTNVDSELLEILLRPADDEGAEHVFLQVFGGPAGPTPESLLPQVECPILGLWGAADPWTPVDRGLHPGNNFGQYNSNFALHVLPSTGHCAHDENPTGCHNIMIPFLQQIESTPV